MRVRLFAFVLFSFACASASLYGQAWDVNPYVGYYWPSTNGQVGEFSPNQTLGVRGGYYVSPDFEIGLNYSWSNHFQPDSDNQASALAGAAGFPQGHVRANLLEVEFTYNFGKRTMLGRGLRPYVVLGAGGLGTQVKDPDTFVLNTIPMPTIALPPAFFLPNDTLESGDKFFTFSYGGGFKASHLWGPVGVFADIRGRALPNFFSGHGTNWPELSAGLNFSWGER